MARMWAAAPDGQQCRAVGPETGRRCTLAAGHDGDHEHVTMIAIDGAPRPDVWDHRTWPQQAT